MKEKDIKHEAGHFWVADCGNFYAVMVVGLTHSVSESAYDRTEDGLSLAVARCNYLDSQHPAGLSYRHFTHLAEAVHVEELEVEEIDYGTEE